MFVGKGGEHAGGVRIFAKNHILRDNWFMGCVYGGMLVYAGEDGHDAAENITMESNTMLDCEGAITLGKSYEEHPVEPIILRENFVSNSNGERMIHHDDTHTHYDFSAGNYFYGEDLGWKGELPEGLVWEQAAKDLGNEGLERLEAIKCRAGPAWEQTC